MSKCQTLRVLVNERLAAAAEEIFVLFERMIAEYAEELYRSNEENQRKQQLLDTFLNQRIEVNTGNVMVSSESSVPDPNPETKEDPEILSVKQEEEQLPVPIPESSAVCVKTEKPLLLQQRQTEFGEETRGEDISLEPHFHSETDNDDWGPVLCDSAAEMETEANGHNYNQVQMGDIGTTQFPPNQPVPETSDHCMIDPSIKTKYTCLVCYKIFQSNKDLKRHFRVHTGERPFPCPICERKFSQKGNLDLHIRIHTGEKRYSCSFCNEQFAYKASLKKHTRLHTERPYSCELCELTFPTEDLLEEHMRVHASEKLYHCSICKKTFAVKRALCLHELKAHKRKVMVQPTLEHTV